MSQYTEAYQEYCKSDRQREVLATVIANGVRGAARKLGVDTRNVERCLALIRRNAELHGYSPEHDATHGVMPTEILRGRSTYYNREGKPTGQWVKTDLRADAIQVAMAAALDAFREDLPKYKPTKAIAKRLNADLCTQYLITDYHFGMLAWGEECGEDWDTDIAEQTLLNWFTAAIKAAPNSQYAVFAQLGDFLHFDGFDAVTPTSRHLLDVDTRFQRVVRVVIRTVRRVIAMLLEKHEYLHIIMADANHDPASGIWLREWLASVYGDDPRITVDNTADTYYKYRFGKTLCFYHHGHKAKLEQVDQILVAKFREDYGVTGFHYAHTGHLHHDRTRESRLMILRQYRTLSASDAYASRHGFMSGRDAPVTTYHREFGQVGEILIGPAMLEAMK